MSSKLPNLEILYLSENYLTNDILPSLEGFTSLKILNLWKTGLDSDLHMEGMYRIFTCTYINKLRIGCNFSISLIKRSNGNLLVN